MFAELALLWRCFSSRGNRGRIFHELGALAVVCRLLSVECPFAIRLMFEACLFWACRTYVYIDWSPGRLSRGWGVWRWPIGRWGRSWKRRARKHFMILWDRGGVWGSRLASLRIFLWIPSQQRFVRGGLAFIRGSCIFPSPLLRRRRAYHWAPSLWIRVLISMKNASTYYFLSPGF